MNKSTYGQTNNTYRSPIRDYLARTDTDIQPYPVVRDSGASCAGLLHSARSYRYGHQHTAYIIIPAGTGSRHLFRHSRAERACMHVDRSREKTCVLRVCTA